MTDTVDIVNRALQYLGTRTTVTSAELTNETTNEAIQANLILEAVRDETLRKAPWDCAFNAYPLTYITSLPGTTENSSPATANWEKGQPMPPWAYEYQYPTDCVRACWIIPAWQTGQAATAVPITTAVTGGAPITPTPPIRFKIGVDQFVPVTAATVSAGGTGYAVGDEITLVELTAGDVPIGAPAVLRVLTAPAGVVATVEVVTQIYGSATPAGGSYFEQQTNPVAQGSTTGSGSGATFTLTYGTKGSQRVILTNQELASLAYVKRITDPNVMDELFLNAWSAILGARLCFALTGDKSLANIAIGIANEALVEARKADANEGLTINNVTPDFIRGRGINYVDGMQTGPYASGFDWGGLWSTY